MTTESYEASWSLTARRGRAATAADWRRLLQRRILTTDLLVVLLAAFGAQWSRFSSLTGDEPVFRQGTEVNGLTYTWISIFLVVVWMWALSLGGTRTERIIGQGFQEYRAVTIASLGVFGGIAIAAYLLQIDVARGYLLISLPVGLCALVLSRWGWRQWLVRRRRAGHYLAHVLLVGSSTAVAQIARELQRAPSAGYHVIGACLPRLPNGGVVPGTTIPVYGTLDQVPAALAATGADTVAVTGSAGLPPDKVKRIAWGLEATGQHLVLAPSIIDVAGPRIHTRDVAGLPLIHVETPQLSTAQRFLKRCFDLAAATLGVLLISPLLLVLAIVVKRSGPGGVFFRQTRVGLDGKPFTMIKFRSMVADAEARKATVARMTAQDAGNAVLTKWRDDPRITPAGRVMRRYSLDELPQLFNVITGSMSLVGPRPPLLSEVAQYDDHVHRRFLMKPGITGLWQVSGRSSLSWEDSVRLDLSYVENYSLISDLIILFRTIRAVLQPGDTAF